MTSNQQEALISYMEKHCAFAQNQFMGLNGSEQRTNQWERLSLILNNIGPQKTVQSWMRVWTNLKRDAREYNAVNDNLRRMTGNDLDQVPNYEETHERILNILGRSHQNGLSLIPEVCSTTSIITTTTNTLSTHTSTPLIPGPSGTIDQDRIMNNHIKETIVQTKIIGLLMSISNNLQKLIEKPTCCLSNSAGNQK